MTYMRHPKKGQVSPTSVGRRPIPDLTYHDPEDIHLRHLRYVLAPRHHLMTGDRRHLTPLSDIARRAATHVFSPSVTRAQHVRHQRRRAVTTVDRSGRRGPSVAGAGRYIICALRTFITAAPCSVLCSPASCWAPPSPSRRPRRSMASPA